MRIFKKEKHFALAIRVIFLLCNKQEERVTFR